MGFAIIAEGRSGSRDNRLDERTAHLDRLVGLKRARSISSARHFSAISSKEPGSAGFIGGLKNVEFDKLDAASVWPQQDHCSVVGVYMEIIARPLRRTLR